MSVSPIICDHGIDEAEPLHRETLLLEAIDRALAGDGWQRAGCGFFSVVYVKDGFALKIGMKQDDMGAFYATWCRANQHLAGVPRIYGITKFRGCYLVLMRRYTPLPKGALHDVAALGDEFKYARIALSGGKQPIVPTDTVLTAGAIGAFFRGVADVDLHEENVMLDDLGNLVITDPLSYGPCSKGAMQDSYYSGYDEDGATIYTGMTH